MDNSLLTRSLWMAGSAENLGLVCLLLRKKLWRRLPLFTALAGYEVFRAVLLFLTSRFAAGHSYFLAYWISEGVDNVLQLGLLWEVFALSTRSSLTRKPVPLRDQPWASIIIGALMAGACSLLLPPTGSLKETVDMRVSMFSSVLACEVFVVASVRMNRLGVIRSSDVMAISQGLAVWAVLSIGSDVIHQLSGWEQHAVRFDQLQSLGVVVILGYWIGAFWKLPSLSQTAEAFTTGGPFFHQDGVKLHT